MQLPRYFSHPQEQSLLPEVMGVERFSLQAAPLIKHRKFRCEISGFQSHPGPDARTAAGYMMLEFRDPRLQGPDARKSGNLRVVDELFYWSRHVDLAIKYKKGDLIFAPWFTQDEVVSLFRTASMTKATSSADSDAKKFATSILGVLDSLKNGELMVSTLGLENEVASWDQAEWLKSLQMMQAKPRKKYMELFAKNVRFLPSPKTFQVEIDHWSSSETKDSLYQFSPTNMLETIKAHISRAL